MSRIMVVDDSEDCRVFLEFMLRQAGYEDIVQVDSAVEAFTRLGLAGAPRPDVTVDLVLLDIGLPDLDGIDACGRIRQDPHLNGVPIIMVTAMPDDSTMEAAFRAGADDYVRKPFDRVELQARLQVGLRVIRLQLQLLDRVRELEEGRARERVLQRLVPICAYCRRIRDDRDYWQGIERYVSQSAGLQFSHGVCPDCVHKMERELEDFRNTLKKD